MIHHSILDYKIFYSSHKGVAKPNKKVKRLAQNLQMEKRIKMPKRKRKVCTKAPIRYLLKSLSTIAKTTYIFVVRRLGIATTNAQQKVAIPRC